MTPLQMKLSVGFIVNGLIVTILFVIAQVLGSYGPEIEPVVAGRVIKVSAPVSTFRGYITRQESNREVEVGCFMIRDIKKLARAHPYKEAFQVETVNGADGMGTISSNPINISLYPADEHHQTAKDFREHKPGEKWDRGYCFEMPGTIADTQRIIVLGHLEHERVIVFGRTNPFWKSETPVPDFTILPTHCYRPDGSVTPDAAACRG